MPLQTAILPIRFAGGVELKEDAKGVAPTKLLALRNAVFTKAISLVKRFGYVSLGRTIDSSPSELPSGVALAKRDDELVMFSVEKAHSYVADAGKWVEAGAMQSVVVSHRVAAKTGTEQTFADMAVLNGIAAYAWEDSRGGCYYAVLDDDSGRVLAGPSLLDVSASRPRVHAVGDYLHIYYARQAAGELWCKIVSPTAPTQNNAAQTLTTSLSTTQPGYDVDTDSTKAAIAWSNNLGGITIGYVHQSGVIGGSGLSLTAPVSIAEACSTGPSISIDPAGTSRIALAWYSSAAGIKVAVRSSTFTSVLAPTVVDSTIAAERTQVGVCYQADSDTGGNRVAHVWYEVTAAKSINRQVLRTTVTEGGSIGSITTQRGTSLISRPFRDGSNVYAHICHDSTYFCTYFTQRHDGMIVARFLPGIAGGTLTKAHLHTVKASGRKAISACIFRVDVGGDDTAVFAERSIRRVELDFDFEQSHRSAQIGGSTYISGGFLHGYDGSGIREAGFHYAPDDVDAPVLSTPTGTGLSEGTRVYRFVYEWANAQGEWEVGGESVGTTVVIDGANQRVTLTIPTYRLTSKTNVRIGVFRSLNGDDAAFYRVSSLDPTAGGITTVNGYCASSTATDAVEFIDEMTDDEAETKEPLYTNGGIVSNDPIGSAKVVAAGKNRLFVVDASEPLRVYYSQELRSGYAPEFSPGLLLSVDPYGGDITGLVVMDDSLIIFKESAVFFVAGPGPLANPAAGGGFTEPQLITSDVGCINLESIGYTPAGVMFQSLKGIYMLGRDRTVRYVGAPVEAYNSQTVAATTLIEDRTQIRFLTSSGITLLYDYYHDQWSEFDNHEGQDALLIGGSYYYLKNSGEVWRENKGSYQDNTQHIKMVMETAWIKIPSYLQGWQRIWYVQILGRYISAHTLRVRMAFDYQDGWGAPIDIDTSEPLESAPYGEGLYGAGVYGGAPDSRYQFQIHVGQECEAIRFRFEDVEATEDYGACYELTELLVVGGVKRGHFAIEEARVH